MRHHNRQSDQASQGAISRSAGHHVDDLADECIVDELMEEGEYETRVLYDRTGCKGESKMYARQRWCRRVYNGDFRTLGLVFVYLTWLSLLAILAIRSLVFMVN